MKKRLKSAFALLVVFIITMMFMFIGLGAGEDKRTQNPEGVLLPIIMYHSLLKDPKLQNDYTVSPDLFENDLKYLNDNGYTTLTVSDLVDYVYSDKILPDKCVMLTFDDGYYNNYYYAYPLLKKYKCKAVISPIVSLTEKFSESDDISVSYGYMNITDINEMLESGYVEIQNHSYDMHKLVPRMGAEQKAGESNDEYKAAITEDINKAQEYLKTNLNITPQCFVYPFGAKSDLTAEIIKEYGFLCTFTCTEETNIITKNSDSLYELGRYRRDKDEDIASFMKRITEKKVSQSK